MGNIIWLASYPRSGNVWLQAFLYCLIHNVHSPPSLDALTAFFTPENSALHFLSHNSRPLGEWSRDETASHRASAQAAIANLSENNVFSKTHAALMIHHGAATIEMAQTAGAIYLVRNPLDIVVSLAAAESMSVDEAIVRLETEHETENSDRFAYECRGSWSSNVLSWTRQSHAGLHLLRFEDLLEAPEKAFGPLAPYLGLDSSPEQISRAIHFSSFSNLAPGAAEGGKSNVLRVGESDQWREALNHEQVSRIVHRHAKQMKRFGYIPDDYLNG